MRFVFLLTDCAVLPRESPNMKKAFLFSPGTGNLWNCHTLDGRGMSIEQVACGQAWDWNASRAWWDSCDTGQAATREEAISAASLALIEAGLSIDDLPSEDAVEPPEPKRWSEITENQSFKDAGLLLKKALLYFESPEKVNIDWLCASIQRNLAGLSLCEQTDQDKTNSIAGAVLAFPGATDEEITELMDSLRVGGNTVLRVHGEQAQIALGEAMNEAALDTDDWVPPSP